MNQKKQIHISQNKNNCFFGVGDIVKGRCCDNFVFFGKISRIDLKKGNNKIYTVIDILNNFPNYDYKVTVWLENIEEMEVVMFKGEK